MAIWDGLLGPDVGLYDELLTEKQRNAINDPFSSRSLAAVSKAFADAARPSLTPGPGLGAALGNAAYMMSAGRDEAAQTLLKAGLTAQQIDALKRQAALQQQVSPYLLEMLKKMGVGSQGGTTPGVPPSAVSPAPAVPRPAPASYAPPPIPNPPAPPGSVPPGSGGEDFLAPSFSSYPKTAGLLPPPDEYIPQQGQGGIFDILNASYGGVGTPGSPFRDGAGSATDAAALLRLASTSGSPSSALNDIPGGVPFSTQARPDAPPIKWTNEFPADLTQPDKFGSTSYGPGSPLGRKPGDSPLASVAALADAANRGDVVIPPAGSIDPALVRMAQARSGGAPGASGPLIPPMPDFRNLPGYQGGGVGDPIPGLGGVSPKELLAIDALAEMAKMGNPFKGFLENYYKSPGYLQDAARAGAIGTLPYDIFKNQIQQRTEYGYRLLTDMAKDNMTLDDKGNIVPMPDAMTQRTMNESEKARVQEEWKARLNPIEADVIGPDGKTVIKQKMTQWEFKQREDAARLRAAGGMTGAPQPGDIAGTKQFDPEQLKGQELDWKILDEKRALADQAQKELLQMNDTRQKIQQGVIAGPGADAKTKLLQFGRALGLAGKDDKQLLANTEAYIMQQGNALKEALKGFGPPISNQDVVIAGRVGGGQNTTIEGMQQILDIREKYHRRALQQFNQMVPKAAPSRFIQPFAEPPRFGATMADGPNGPIWYDTVDKQWKPAQ